MEIIKTFFFQIGSYPSKEDLKIMNSCILNKLTKLFLIIIVLIDKEYSKSDLMNLL